MATKVIMVYPVVITNPQFVIKSKLNGFHINDEPYTKVNLEVFTDEEGGFNCSCEYNLIRAELNEKYFNKVVFESVSKMNTRPLISGIDKSKQRTFNITIFQSQTRTWTYFRRRSPTLADTSRDMRQITYVYTTRYCTKYNSS